MGDLARSSRSESAPLQQFIARVEGLFAAGEVATIGDMLTRDLVLFWFGFTPSRLAELLRELSQREDPGGRIAEATFQAIFGDDLKDIEQRAAELVSTDSELLPDLMQLSDVFKLRMSGQPVTALRLAEKLGPRTTWAQQVFGTNRGWNLFVAVQLGITAMYAGEFSAAIAYFTKARTTLTEMPFIFLRRDAIVKTALIESLYGDTEQAAALLDEAATIPYCGSWVEQEIDAAQAIAASQLAHGTVHERLAALRSVPLHHLGELWPFYLVAMQRLLRAAGNPEDAVHQVAMFERMQLTHSGGEGFTGSVLMLAAGMDAVLQGDFATARDRLARADQSLPLTSLTNAALELAAGRPRIALEWATGAREATRGLRTLNLWRHAIMAGSHLQLREEDECREVLEFVLRQPGGLRSSDLGSFLPQVHEFASAQVAGWPTDDAAPPFVYQMFPVGVGTLTQREHDVLRAVAQGGSRETIARSLFISVNTLKAHLRSIYRKLGVRSRTAAVLEAERRGLL